MDGLAAMPPLAAAGTDLASLSGRNLRSDPQAQEEVCKQFEGVFASMLVKEMRKSLDPETMFGSDPGDVMGGMFDFFMGQHLAATGRLGLAQSLRKQLFRTGSVPPS